jgi:hypothetical protein
MSIISEIVVGRRDETKQILANADQAKALPTLEANTVDVVKLASLALLLKGEPLDDDLVIEQARHFEEIGQQGDNGPWLYVFPNDLCKQLANLNEEHALSVAVAWSETEEARLDRWNPSDTAKFLKDLSRLASTARNVAEDLILFVSL